MRLSKKVYAALIITLFIILGACKLFYCSVTDREAILLANNFIKKLDIKPSKLPHIPKENQGMPFLPWLLITFDRLFFTEKVKEVVVGEKRNYEITVDVSCKDKEVIRFIDWQVMNKIFRKYSIAGNRKPQWPTHISEDKAKQIILFHANKIGLPKDVEFFDMALDLQSRGTWKGSWIRKFNGYPYEDDRIDIEIMAIDGEFFLYRKVFKGKPCPTVVKVSKEEAIAVGWSKISKYFDPQKWEQVKKEYEVESAELKIVQSNVFLGMVVPIWKSNKSRLAWVVEYDLRKAPDSKQYDIKRADFNYHDKFIIKIDAASKKLLGGVTGRYQ